MAVHTFRLKPGEDLKTSIEAYCKTNLLRSVSVLTCVGGLNKASLRMAGATPQKQDIRTYSDNFEIISLVGTVSQNGTHLHMSISDSEGRVIGGHLKEGSIVHPTAEIVIFNSEAESYKREYDENTGFDELNVTPSARQ